MTKQSKAAVTSTVTSAAKGFRFYRITNTDICGASKEELKSIRRDLNATAGTHEVGNKSQGTEATPSNKWAHRITKGPDHLHNQAGYVPVGKTYRSSVGDVILKNIGDGQVKNIDSGAIGKMYTPDIVKVL